VAGRFGSMRQRPSGFASRAKGARLARFANRSGAFGLRPSGRVARQPCHSAAGACSGGPRRRPQRQTFGRVLSSRATLVVATLEQPSAMRRRSLLRQRRHLAVAPGHRQGVSERRPSGCLLGRSGARSWGLASKAKRLTVTPGHPARCFRARRPSWLPRPDGCIDSSGGLPLLRRMRLRHRATGMVPPGRLALVATKLGWPVSPTARACFRRHDTVLRTRPIGKAPSSTAALVAAPREGPCHRQWRFASAVATPAAAALPTAELLRVRSPLWWLGSDGPCRPRRRLAFDETDGG
jgi:hypothetical protein